MKKFADIVERVKDLSLEEKEDLQIILDRILTEERREEILDNHKASLKELKAGKLKFHSSAETLLRSLQK